MLKKTNGGDLVVNLEGRGAAEKLRDEIRDKTREKNDDQKERSKTLTSWT